MNTIMNRVLNKIGNWNYNRLDYFNTLLINFRLFPLKTAIKMPIYVYKNTEIQQLGEVVINAPIKSGMIKIGNNSIKSNGKTKFRGKGKFIFKGEAQLWGGCVIENYGIIEMGNCVALAENCRIMCKDHIVFEDYVHFGFDCTIMDTDFHYVIDTTNCMIKRATIPIKIKTGTWISSDVKIMKGSVIPEKSIVVSGSTVNKNHEDIPGETIFAGTPAKAIKSNVRRLYNVIEERNAHIYFKENENVYEKKLEVETTLDEFCYKYCLNFYQPK